MLSGSRCPSAQQRGQVVVARPPSLSPFRKLHCFLNCNIQATQCFLGLLGTVGQDPSGLGTRPPSCTLALCFVHPREVPCQAARPPCCVCAAKATQGRLGARGLCVGAPGDQEGSRPRTAPLCIRSLGVGVGSGWNFPSRMGKQNRTCNFPVAPDAEVPRVCTFRARRLVCARLALLLFCRALASGGPR